MAMLESSITFYEGKAIVEVIEGKSFTWIRINNETFEQEVKIFFGNELAKENATILRDALNRYLKEENNETV